MATTQTIGTRQIKVLAAIDASCATAKDIAAWIEQTTNNSTVSYRSLPQTLKELENRGFVTSQKEGACKIFTITPKGANEYQERLDELSRIQSAVQQEATSAAQIAEEVAETFSTVTNNGRKPTYKCIEKLLTVENAPIQNLFTLHKQYNYLKGKIYGFNVLAITSMDNAWYEKARSYLGYEQRFANTDCFYLNPETGEWIQAEKDYTENSLQEMNISARALLAAATL